MDKRGYLYGNHWTRSRLCTLGFKEEQHFHIDSPTCCKEGLPGTSCIIAAKKGVLNSLGIKTEFLPGEQTEFTVYLNSPQRGEN